MLLTLGFILMAVQHLVEVLPFISDVTREELGRVMVWFGVVVSLAFACGVFLIQKIFKYMRRVEDSRRLTEKMFLRTIIQTEEKERKRFSKDLHDGLGPLLSCVKLSVSALSQLKKTDKADEILGNTEMAIDEAIKSLKEISNNLSPHTLDLGLLSALRSFINRINITGAIKINVTTNIEDERFDPDMEVVLYRVLCELINNTIKHAGATVINIRLFMDNKKITAEYQDNGVGFKMSKNTDTDRGQGLKNLVTRITSLKGDIKIHSQPGEGMSAVIKINTEEI
jgi:signal transduction histidine kinase